MPSLRQIRNRGRGVDGRFSRSVGFESLEKRRVLAATLAIPDIDDAWSEVRESEFIREFLSAPLTSQGATLSFDSVDMAFGQWSIENSGATFEIPESSEPKYHFNVGIVGEVDVFPAFDFRKVEASLFSGYTLSKHLNAPGSADDYWELARGNVLEVGPAQLSMEYFAKFDTISTYSTTDSIEIGMRVGVSGEVDAEDILRLLGIQLNASVGSNFATVEVSTGLTVGEFLSTEYTDQPSLGLGLADLFVPYLGEGISQNPIYGATQFLPFMNAASFAGINPLDAFVSDTPIGLLAKRGLEDGVSLSVYDGSYLSVDSGDVLGVTTPFASVGINVNAGVQARPTVQLLEQIIAHDWGFGEVELIDAGGVKDLLPPIDSITGATIVVHGFQAGGAGSGDALEPISNAILQRTDGWLVDYDVVDDAGAAGFAPPRHYQSHGTGAEIVLQFDWAIESNNDSSGWAEAAGDRLFAMLVELGLVDPAEGEASVPLHFISHSFGAGVASEAVERLAAHSILVDHVTFLDPHDFDQAFLPIDGSQDIRSLGAPVGYGASRWDNVLNMDVYYQTRGVGVGTLGDLVVPEGRPIPGAYNVWLRDEFHLPDDDLVVTGDNLGDPYLGWGNFSVSGDHGFVWNGFYLGTILGRPADGPVSESFFGWSTSGYSHSRVGRESTGASVPNAVFFNESSLFPQDHQHSASTLVDTSTGLPNNVGLNSLGLVAGDITDASWPADVDPLSLVNGGFDHFESGEILSSGPAPGWSYQGGGGSGVVERTVDANADPIEVLSLQAGNPQRTHNDAYVPVDANSIEFTMWTPFSSTSDRLLVFVDETEIGSVTLSTVTGQFEQVSFPMPPAYRNTVSRIGFALDGGGSGIEAQVLVDDISFSRDATAVPEGNPGGPYYVSEGGQVTLDASGSQAGVPPGSQLDYWWDLDGDGVFGETGAGASRGLERGNAATLTLLPSDNGPDRFSISLRVGVVGKLGEAVETSVFVENAAPAITISGPTTLTTNQPNTYQVSVFDPSQSDRDGFDSSDWRWTATSRSESFSGTGAEISFTPSVDEQFDLTVRVSDDVDTAVSTRVVNIQIQDLVEGALDQPIAGVLPGSESVLYAVPAEPGDTITVSAYFGSTSVNSNRRMNGLWNEGRIRLIAPDGEVVAAPSNRTNGSSHTQAFWSVLNEHPVSQSGTYYVEVFRSGTFSPSNYWLGIGDPIASYEPLSLTGQTAGEFGTWGEIAEWQFEGTQGEAVGWVYAGARNVGDWSIVDPDGVVVRSGTADQASQAFVFTPSVNGTHHLIFDTQKTTGYSSIESIGPFSYTLSAMEIGRLDDRIDDSLPVGESDLYAVPAEPGDTITVSAYFGSTSVNSNRRVNGLWNEGRIRLIAPDGEVVAAPSNRTNGSSHTQAFWSVLNEHPVSQPGTYYVEVFRSGTFSPSNYWLGIGDPIASYEPLSLTGQTAGEFGTWGEIAEWQFEGTQGEAVGWVYAGARRVGDWSIVDPDGVVVQSGTANDASLVFAVTPTISGPHRLIFDAEKVSSYDSAASIGPFSYELRAMEPIDFGDAPSPFPSSLSANGARHFATGPRLGSQRDIELDANSNAAATGDGGDDDGVLFGVVAPNSAVAAMNIELQNADAAFVDAWIDLNGDGDWNDSGEKIMNRVSVNRGLQTINYNLPSSGISAGETFARVRISSVGGLDIHGVAEDGEVEDYKIVIGNLPNVTAAFVNDNQTSRSELTTIDIEFDSVVAVDPGSFELLNLATNEPVTGVSVVTDSSLGTTAAKLAFTGGPSVLVGAGILLPTLADGNYRLSYLSPGSDGAMTQVAIDEVHRKYGDTNGDGIVSLTDFAAFRGAYGTVFDAGDLANGFRSDLDANRDGEIGLADFAAFRRGFGA